MFIAAQLLLWPLQTDEGAAAVAQACCFTELLLLLMLLMLLLLSMLPQGVPAVCDALDESASAIITPLLIPQGPTSQLPLSPFSTHSFSSSFSSPSSHPPPLSGTPLQQRLATPARDVTRETEKVYQNTRNPELQLG
jgi:hypothetical protein